MKSMNILRLLTISVLLILFSDAESQAVNQEIMQSPTRMKQVGLAFDDISNSHFVNESMGFMAKYDIRSTWYADGEEIMKNSSLLKKLAENGHEIGNRGIGDEFLTVLEPAKITQNIIDAGKIIRELTGKSAVTFMAPYQKINDSVMNVLNNQNLTVFIPSLVVDYKVVNSCEGLTMYLQYLMSEIQSGSSILFTEQNDNLIILRHLLRMLNDKGYEVVPVSKVGAKSTH